MIFEKMNKQETVAMLKCLLLCIDDKTQGERDNRTVLEKVTPSVTEFILKSAIEFLEPEKDDFYRKEE